MFDTFQQKFNGFQSLKCKSFDTEFMTENHAIHKGGTIPQSAIWRYHIILIYMTQSITEESSKG